MRDVASVALPLQRPTAAGTLNCNAELRRGISAEHRFPEVWGIDVGAMFGQTSERKGFMNLEHSSRTSPSASGKEIHIGRRTHRN